MKFEKIFLLVCCGAVISLQANGQRVGSKKNDKVKERASIVASETGARLDKQASELMADRVSPTKVASEELALEKMAAYNEQMAKENTAFPALDLYNSNWDTLHVNPFAKEEINYPDNYKINCSTFVMPLNDNGVRVTSKYGPRRRRMHRGIDLGLHVGDTVRAAFDGKVRIKSFERRGYGYYIVIRHYNGLETVYGHLSKFLVRENTIVKAGQPIALGGNTGRSTGPHLHFETRFLGKDINPAEIIDFKNGVPFKDEYVFRNIKIRGKKSNIYTTSNTGYAVHRVRSGETLSSIARKYGTTVDELCRLNNITRRKKLHIGQAIQFRTKEISIEAEPKEIKRADEQSESTNMVASVKTKELKKTKNHDSDIVENGIRYHRLQRGDTLYSLSKKYGISIEKLCELNGFNSNTILKAGKKIRCS